MSNNEHFFNFPASRGLQGKTVILLINVPARALTRLLASDNIGHTLERSQRELNMTRVKKFYNYLVDAHEKNEPFIIPPLVGNCDSFVEFDEVGTSGVGTARIPMDAEIKLFDGQHRAAGITQFCKSTSETLFVPLMLTIQLPLKVRQQFFSDINNNTSKPSAAINMAYDGRNELAQGMAEYLSKHQIFSEITDFEHNIVPAKSDLWVSFKALSDATAKFATLPEMPAGGQYLIWDAWLDLSATDSIRHGVSQAEYKKEYIQFHAVMINAFGFAIQHLIRDGVSVRGIVSMVRELVNSASLEELEEFFLISSWDGLCASTEKERATVIASIPAQKAAAARLVSVLKSGTFKAVTNEQ